MAPLISFFICRAWHTIALSTGYFPLSALRPPIVQLTRFVAYRIGVAECLGLWRNAPGMREFEIHGDEGQQPAGGPVYHSGLVSLVLSELDVAIPPLTLPALERLSLDHVTFKNTAFPWPSYPLRFSTPSGSAVSVGFP
ncbi:hypothetical protein C8J57DRAFT_1504219 [Mycena rebaudengoi]|nr:hypothetical protein C8J57DRAFT_1504219 [Mycena rebaudengoi]